MKTCSRARGAMRLRAHSIDIPLKRTAAAPSSMQPPQAAR
jgi:hypothetical protein